MSIISRRRTSMRLLLAVALVAVMGMATTVVVAAEPTVPTVFVVPLSAAEEVPLCEAAGPDARGVAIFRVVDEAAGTVEYMIIATDLPGTLTGAHIHVGPAGVAGPVVQDLPLTGAESGVIGEGTFTNPDLLAAIAANPQNYYVNVHTDVCEPGAIRGQFGSPVPLPPVAL
jgi:hypothetical protein